MISQPTTQRVAFFVLGPESSGTRMLTRAFVQLGVYGDYTNRQRLDNLDFTQAPGSIVFRRGLPHAQIGHEMPPIAHLVRLMEKAGFDQVVPILILRDKDATVRAQIKHQWVYTEQEAATAISKAIDHVYSELATLNRMPVVIHFEPFVQSPVVRRLFFQSFGLPEPDIGSVDIDKAQ